MMKKRVVNPKITLLIFTIMFLTYGITNFNHAHNVIGVPHFHGDTADRSIAENAAADTNIGDPLTAHSTGLYGRHVLSGEDADSFSIDKGTGQLKTKAVLDYETKDTYSVTVIIQTAELDPLSDIAPIISGWVDRDSITVTINVVDVVLQFTEGDSTKRSIAEDTPANRNIGSPVTATNFNPDLDRYVLRGTDAGSFSLNSETGQLKTKASLNYEIKANYYVTIGVKAGEQSEEEDSISVRIKVIDGTDSWCPYGYTLIGDRCVEWAPQHSGEGGGFGEADTLPPISSEEAARITSLLTMDRIIFNELFNASDDAHDWLELRNVSDMDVDLSGWTLIVTTRDGGKSVAFPVGTVLLAGELLLFVNTDPNAPDMPLAPSESALYHIDEGFTLPQEDFILLLRSPSAWEDSAGNYFFGHEKPPTAPLLTSDMAWSRAKSDVIGTRAEAWASSGYQGGLGYDDGAPEGTSLGTPGHHRQEIAAAQVGDGPVIGSASENYTFETIDVPGVDFLALTASSDFEDYAGYTKSAEGGKEVAFTLIDGVFETYDFPGSQNTYFFALGNNGNAAGYYEDSEGKHRGIVLQDSELQQYDFPGAVETEIYGISDATGALTGNFIDVSGVRRGFSGDEIIEYPGATETFADFVNASGGMVGSYIDAEGLYHPYIRTPEGRFVSLDLPSAAQLEYFFVHGINDARVVVARTKRVGGVPGTLVGTFQQGLKRFQVPGSVSTEGYNINQDGSIVGHYESTDGRRLGFIARLAGQVDEPIATPTGFNYTFESIDVPGVDFLAVTASSDFQDYAGYTKSAEGEKEVAFTLIDGVFMTYDFPGSQNTYFYALGNNGNAAGYYEDSEGKHRGIVLQDGELRQYDFPGAVETEIYGISDATGALTGNFIDASGVRRGFSGDAIIEYPEATETFADFVNASGRMVGSYVDAEGLYHPYIRTPEGRFISIDLPQTTKFEYFFVHGINDVGTLVSRTKRVGGVPRTSVGSFQHGLHELLFPGSVSTEGWNINQDGSVVGHYDSPDGRRHGFIARLGSEAVSTAFSNTYTVKLSKGLNMLSVPLAPWTPMTAKRLVALTGATTLITLDAATQRFIAWTPGAPNDGFPIEGGKGYIVNVPQTRNFAFVGAPWTDQMEENAPAAPPISTALPQEAWAFVVSGHLEGTPAFDGYQVRVRNLRTHSVITAPVQADYFAAATADLKRRSVVQVGDVIELRVIGPGGNVESQTLNIKVTPEHLANAVLSVNLDSIGQPTRNLLLQNYPNPFNPETWIPYQLSEASPVSVSIYDTTGKLVRTLSLGYQSAGFYNSRDRAAYWDGRNNIGERVSSGLYFYILKAGDFSATRKMLILK